MRTHDSTPGAYGANLMYIFAWVKRFFRFFLIRSRDKGGKKSARPMSSGYLTCEIRDQESHCDYLDCAASKFSDTELMQYRNPVGSGPSANT